MSIFFSNKVINSHYLHENESLIQRIDLKSSSRLRALAYPISLPQTLLFFFVVKFNMHLVLNVKEATRSITNQ